MGDQPSYLALDFGAESGRAVLGRLEAGRLRLAEVHRFPNLPRRQGGTLRWDARGLFEELKLGLKRALEASDGRLASVGVDTWGVDFALIDAAGELLADPVHYRDERTRGIAERAFQIVPRERIYELTGIQFLPFNSLFQLLATKWSGPETLQAADRLLMMSDLFHFWLTGRAANEFTNATTTQCYDPRGGDWAWPLLDSLDLPRRLFGEIAAPGTKLGPLRPDLARQWEAPSVEVLLPATHDTASAVLAAPAESAAWAYISCGTWSLLGAETRAPRVTPAALAANFTNEGGAFGTNRLLVNIMGLWLIQRLRADAARRGRTADYDELIAAAEAAPAFGALVDPDDPAFLNPPEMAGAIDDACRRTGQPPPTTEGGYVRCALESLALKYRYRLEQLEGILGEPVEVLHLIGGGSRNAFLCRATADACARPVLAGPAEATALGNLLMQAFAHGEVADQSHLRAIVRESCPPRRYDPSEPDRWETPYRRWVELMGAGGGRGGVA